MYYWITNRKMNGRRKGVGQLGESLNTDGANELRVGHAERDGKRWDVTVYPDLFKDFPKSERDEVNLPKGYAPVYGSEVLAARIFEEARTTKRNVLFFVHGYNNNAEAVLDRMERIAEAYNVIVVGFTWPANGGGARGALDYLSDKRDARASAGALERSLKKAFGYLVGFTRDARSRVSDELLSSAGNNEERRVQKLVAALRRECPFRVSLMCHSMGNYVYKWALKSSQSEANQLLFDNVLLVAADTNNKDHAEWVDRIQFRNRLYITINEEDGALALSRMKLGEAQLARLGHYKKGLNARNATYIDFTNVACVGDSHAYFENEPIENPFVKSFFQAAFNGQAGENAMSYIPDLNIYRPEG